MRSDPRILAAVEAAARDGRIVSAVGVNPNAFVPGSGTAVYVPPPEPGADEDRFQALVVSLFEGYGWDVYHTYDSRRSNPGEYDLQCCRERLIKIELKVLPNKPSKAQIEKKKVYDRAGVENYVFYPDQWDQIVTLAKTWRDK